MSNLDDKYSNEDYWKSIILFGLNQATYKIALGSVLLDFAKEGRSVLKWEDLSKAFLDKYIERLSKSSNPQQANPTRSTKMESIIARLRLGAVSYEDALVLVGKDAFNDVIPRFHSIGKDNEFAKDRFYTYQMGKQLEISPNAHELAGLFEDECRVELECRWALLEGAFVLSRGDATLENDIRDIYLSRGYDRTPLTKNIVFLRAYQGDVCFYCGESLSLGEIEVDHVLPRQVIQHDEVWNLVLSHSICNHDKLDYLVGPHYIEKLICRNENIMGSNHPWKAKIASCIGVTAIERRGTIELHYQNVKTVLRSNFWKGVAGYSAENDLFFRRLITKLNRV